MATAEPRGHIRRGLRRQRSGRRIPQGSVSGPELAAAPAPPAEPLPTPRRRGKRHGPSHGTGLAAEAIDGNCVLARDQVTAWYVLPLQRWSFRPPAERSALTGAMTARLSQLAGRRIYIRVTTRPFETWRWAAELDGSIRGRHPVMRGPCPAHPHLSVPGCPSCLPGHAWLDWLGEQQGRIWQWGITERVVFLGVQVANRGGLARLLGGAWDRAAGLEMAGLSAAADQISAVVAGAGLNAAPATTADVQWLVARSYGLHLPAPAATEQNPAPFPYALPVTGPGSAGPADLGQLASVFRWSARPFGRTVLVARADGAAAHVAVLTVAGMTDQDDTGPSPWAQRTDRLGFPAEWMITADVRRREEVAREMRHLVDRIRHQSHHITVEHGQPAPLSLDRQMQAARRIEDESQTGPEAFASRMHAWIRIAVAGETEQQALERARRVAELYAPAITVAHTPGQYALAREFIPGEPLADFGHRRAIETAALAAGMPTASALVGHRHGFPVEVTTSTAARAVMWHPWHGMEKLNHSGLITVTGTLGGGKSSLAGLITYTAVRAGITAVVLDPSGLLDRLCGISEIAPVSLAVNLLDSPPGTLSPYRLIPDPPPLPPSRGRPPEAVRERRERDMAAVVARRALVADILKMLLPARVLDETTEFAISEAVRRAPATMSSSPQQVIAALNSLDRHGLGDRGALLADILEGIAEHPLARLFFPAADGAGGTAIRQGTLLSVLNLRGLVLPGEARPPVERTTEEQLSIPVLHLAAQLVRRMLLDLPRGARKLAVLDEAHALTRDPVGRAQVLELARDSRKNNVCAIVVSQNPSDLIAAGIANLVGTVFAFRTEGEEQGATLDLLGLARGAGHEQRLASLSGQALAGSGATGECLMRDGQGGIEQAQVDLGHNPALLAALDSTPTGRSATGTHLILSTSSGSGPYFVMVTSPFRWPGGRACEAAGSRRARTSGV